MRPTQDEQAVLTQWLQLPRVRQIFRMDPENIERIFSAVKNRRTGKFKQGSGGFEYEVTIPESVKELTITNLNSQLQFYVDQDDFTMVKKSDARIAREQQQKQDREAASEAQRIANDPVIQAQKKAEREQAERDAKAVRDAAEKEYWTERALKQPGENSLQCLQRYRRERIEAGKEVPTSVFAGPSTPAVWDIMYPKKEE